MTALTIHPGYQGYPYGGTTLRHFYHPTIPGDVTAIHSYPGMATVIVADHSRPPPPESFKIADVVSASLPAEYAAVMSDLHNPTSQSHGSYRRENRPGGKLWS